MYRFKKVFSDQFSNSHTILQTILLTVYTHKLFSFTIVHNAVLVERDFGQSLDDWIVEGCVREDGTDKRMCSPQMVRDNLTTTQIFDRKTQLPVTLVRFKHRCSCVVAQILKV